MYARVILPKAHNLNSTRENVTVKTDLTKVFINFKNANLNRNGKLTLLLNKVINGNSTNFKLGSFAFEYNCAYDDCTKPYFNITIGNLTPNALLFQVYFNDT